MLYLHFNVKIINYLLRFMKLFNFHLKILKLYITIVLAYFDPF